MAPLEVSNLTCLVGDRAAEGREGVLLALTRPRQLTPHAQQAQLVAPAGEHAARAAPVPLQSTYLCICTG